MNKPDLQPRPSGTRSSGTPSIIGDDVTIEGNVITTTELQLDGTVKGDISCGSLTMGENGTCTGTITADNAIIRGKVEGQIRARTVRLEQTARVNGDVTHQSLAVEAGAILSGKFTHSENPLGKAAAASSGATTIERAQQQGAQDSSPKAKAATA